MNKAQQIASYAIRKIWLLCVVSLVLMALTISVLRLSLPYLNDYRGEIQNWAKANYNATVLIGDIEAEWKTHGPALLFNNIHLQQDQGSPIALNVDSVTMKVDFWQSLLSRQLISQSFTLSGVEVELQLARLTPESSGDYPIITALQELFLEQLTRFSIVDSSLLVVSEKRPTQVIAIENLSWLNKDARHQGIGSLKVQELTSNSLEFILDIDGEPGSLTGQFYSKASQLEISPWLEQFLPQDRQVTDSRLNFESWLDFSQNGISHMLVRLNDNQINWRFEQQDYQLGLSGGVIYMQPSTGGWLLSSEGSELTIADKTMEDFQVNLKQQHGDYALALTSLDISQLLPLGSLLLDSTSLDAVAGLNPVGQLDNFLALVEQQELYWQAEFSELAWEQSDAIPALNHLQGKIAGGQDKAWLEFESLNGVLNMGSILVAPVEYQRISGRVELVAQQDNFIVRTQDIQLDNDEISIRPEFVYDSASGDVSLFTKVLDMPVRKLVKYLPTSIGSNTRKYLNKAMLAGQTNNAYLLLQGDPTNFPFNNNEGVFQAAVTLVDLDLRFSPEWPELAKSEVDLLFHNRSLDITAKSGQLLDLPVTQAHAHIEDLANQPLLRVTSSLTAPANKLHKVFKQSMLKDSVANVMEQLVIEGDIAGDFILTVDLLNETASAVGSVNFLNNQIYIEAIEQTLENVSGRMTFSDADLNTDLLQAKLWGMPIGLSFVGESTSNGYLANIKTNGHWQSEQVFEFFPSPMDEYIDGTLDWKANLKLDIGEDDFSYNFHLTSDMPQIISKLPAPYNKSLGEAYRLSLLADGNKQNSSVHLNWGEQLRFTGYLPHQDKKFSRAHLILGEPRLVDMANGFGISVRLKEANFSPWSHVIDALIEDVSNVKNSFIPAPQRIDVEVADFLFLGQKFKNAELELKRQHESWYADVLTDELRGDLWLYDDWLGKGLRFEADYITLNEWQSEESSEQPFSSSELPPMTISCKRCQLFDIDLGRIDLEVSRHSHGMAINRLLVGRNGHKLEAAGLWNLDSDQQTSNFVGEINTPEFGELLADLGMKSGIKDSSGNLAFDLNWQGAPYEFDLATLNGKVNWRLSEGYLSDVSDKGARLLSLLSLDSMVRKLRLDFRDVFSKGFFYNKVRGDIQLTNGVASTDNVKIDGLPGDMEIRGYTDLVARKLDYKVSFKPKVTSSLPVIVAWMINPATGLAALALDEVIQSAEVVAKIEYSLTGSIEDPVLTELGRQSKEVTLPARIQPKSEPSQTPELEPPVTPTTRAGLGTG